MYSVKDDLAAGFPHSEIFGSKLVCQLPEAYRRLLRPSSPSVAKASTTCAYSLDHITPSVLGSYVLPADFNSRMQYTRHVSRELQIADATF